MRKARKYNSKQIYQAVIEYEYFTCIGEYDKEYILSMVAEKYEINKSSLNIFIQQHGAITMKMFQKRINLAKTSEIWTKIHKIS